MPKYSENGSQCNFLNHKPHLEWTVIESGPQRHHLRPDTWHRMWQYPSVERSPTFGRTLLSCSTCSECFWRKNGYECMVPGSWHWQGWKKYLVKYLSQCHLVHHRSGMTSGCRVGKQRLILSHSTVLEGSKSSKSFKLIFYRTQNIVLPSV
jgi:hypothetical protein